MGKKSSRRNLDERSRRILLNALRGVEAQVPKWKKGLYREITQKTVLRPVEDLGVTEGGFKTRGENVRHVVVRPGQGAYIGSVEIFLPKSIIRKVADIDSRDRSRRKAAEDAMQVAAHEFAHNWFGAIDYENKWARYYYFNEKPLKRQLAGFLESGGRFGKEKAKDKAKELVNRDPLFWANYAAHAQHEAAADIMGARAVSMVVHGRMPTQKEMREWTMYRPMTVREMVKGMASDPVRKPKKRKFNLAGRLEEFSGGMMRMGSMGRHLNPLEAIEAMKIREMEMKKRRAGMERMPGGRKITRLPKAKARRRAA